jgi:hypothetical protein
MLMHFIPHGMGKNSVAMAVRLLLSCPPQYGDYNLPSVAS